MVRLISRNEARNAKLKRYFTGESCSHGHAAERFVSSCACVACHAERNDPEYQARWREGHKEERKQYQAVYYAENSDTLRAYARRYRKDNTEAVRDADRRRGAKLERRAQQSKNNRTRYQRDGERIRKRESKRYRQERERIKARVAQYRKDNPEKVRLINRIGNAAIRAIRKGAPGKYGKADVVRLFVAQEGKCVGCRSDLGDFHVDHILALTRGGTNWPDNLQLLCVPCNLSKGTKTMDEWREWLAHP